MRIKRPNVNPATKCQCSMCGLKAGSAIPGKPHRNCNGLGRARPYSGRVPSKLGRGVWEEVGRTNN